MGHLLQAQPLTSVSSTRKKNTTILTTIAYGFGLLFLGLVCVSNSSLNTQVNDLQNELNQLRHLQQLHQQDLSSERFLLHLSDNDIEGSVSNTVVQQQQEQEQQRHLGRSRRGKGKGKGGKGGSKSSSSKKSKRGSTSNDNDFSVRYSCRGLNQLVDDLTMKVREVDQETLTLLALTDDLEQTTIIASGGGNGDGRQRQRELFLADDIADGDHHRMLQSDTTGNDEDELDVYTGQLTSNVETLVQQRYRLQTQNGRVNELNLFLRQSAVDWINSNGRLTNQNLELTEENQKLMNERSRLNEQIDELNGSIKALEARINDHSNLNDELSDAADDLEEYIRQLEEANAEYTELNRQLESNINDLRVENDQLKEQNNVFAQLNSELNATSMRLGNQVSELSDEIDSLQEQNIILDDNVDNLETQIQDLQVVNDNLESNVNNLTIQVTDLTSNVSELQRTNSELETIVDFIDETSDQLDSTYDSITQYLSQQIIAYHSIAIDNLELGMQNRVQLWDCNYRQSFAEFPFTQNDNVPIGNGRNNNNNQQLNMVMEYVDDRILSELCLDELDFETYLQDIFNQPVFTTNHLVSGINSYTTLAFDHYFGFDHDNSDNDNNGSPSGLTTNDWIEAQYDCENLPSAKRFKQY